MISYGLVLRYFANRRKGLCDGKSYQEKENRKKEKIGDCHEKILVVDDSALMRRVLCDIIEQDKRFQVVEKATNGLEALELLKKNTYDAVVLDVNMPKMSGLELLKELQKNKIAARVVMASRTRRKVRRLRWMHWN